MAMITSIRHLLAGSLLLPATLAAQTKRDPRMDRLKADLDYEINLKAELEVAQLQSKVDRIYEEMQAHFDRLHRGTATGK